MLKVTWTKQRDSQLPVRLFVDGIMVVVVVRATVVTSMPKGGKRYVVRLRVSHEKSVKQVERPVQGATHGLSVRHRLYLGTNASEMHQPGNRRGKK